MSDNAQPPAQLMRRAPNLDNLPAEVIMMIFHQLCFVVNDGRGHSFLSDDRITTMAELNMIATTSKWIYACFKEGEFVIFRRLVFWTMPDNADCPGFADLVIKVGALRASETRPTDPVEIGSVLHALKRDEVNRQLLGARFTTPEVHIELDPRLYDGVLDWLASRFRSEYIDNDARRRLDRRVHRGPNLPHGTFVQHPFDVAYPLTLYRPPGVPKSARAMFYIDTLLEELERYRQHVDVPWTEAESKYLIDCTVRPEEIQGTFLVPYRPCCLAGDCPRWSAGWGTD